MLKDEDTLSPPAVEPGYYQISVIFGQVVANSTVLHLALSLKRIAQATVPVTVSADSS